MAFLSPRLFEDATDKLNLVALGAFLYQLKKASQSQLFHSVTDTVDYSLAMPGTAPKAKGAGFAVRVQTSAPESTTRVTPALLGMASVASAAPGH